MSTMTTIISKRTTRIPIVAFATLALLVAASTHAQTEDQSLSLFEPVEQPADNNQVQTSGPRNPAVTAGGSPQFSLVGTSRFGNRYRVSVRDSSGEVITVDAGDGGSAAIPGYPGFRVTGVESREVLLQHPDDTPCFDFTDHGVTCQGGNTARLALATAEAVVPPPEPELRRDRRADNRDAQSADATGQADEARPENPFAAALRAARERGESGEPDAAASRAEEQRFRPRRIDPEDVPEGFRLIRTPFGDRVVPR